MMKSGSNRWKLAFISLAAVCIGILISLIVIFFMFFSGSDSSQYIPQEPTGEQALLQISSNREQLNNLIANATDELAEDTPYTIEVLQDDIEFQSSFSVLGQSVPITVEFVPDVAENGDLLLEAQHFSFGPISLPSEQAMQLMSNVTNLPEWVVFYPSNSVIELRLSEASFNDQYSFRATAFDLEADQIEFEMYVKE